VTELNNRELQGSRIKRSEDSYSRAIDLFDDPMHADDLYMIQ
jgi:hypothetical protein